MRKRFRVSLAVCFTAIIWAGVAHAEPGTTFVLGAGMNSCGRLIAAICNTPPGQYQFMNTANGAFINQYAQ